MEEEINLNEVESCPTCGRAVVLRGRVTRYYVPVSDAKLEEIQTNAIQNKKIESR